MSSETGTETDHYAVFDNGLERAEDALEVARSRYRGLGELEAPIPDSFAGALSELEDDIEAIDEVLDVSEAEAAEAQALAERGTLLSDVLDASWQFYTALVDTELDIYDRWASHLEGRLNEAAQDLSRDIQALRELAANDNYGQLYSGEQFTVMSIRSRLESYDSEAREELPVSEYVRYCIAIANELEEEFIEDVKRLVQAGEPLRIKEERTAVSSRVDELEAAVENGTLEEAAPAAARTGLEGAMMLRYRTAHAALGHEYRERLRELVETIDDVDETVVSRIEECEARELPIAIEQVVIGETTRSLEEQVTALLKEHDGSLHAALSASELDAQQFFDALHTAFVEDTITDIQVQFE